MNINFTKYKYICSLTKDNKLVFSLKAPTHPVNPITKVTVPINMRINAGSSSAKFVALEILLMKTFFSDKAQNPIAKTIKPINCKN